MNEKIINKYQLKNVELFCRSNYGIIYKAISEKYCNVIIKENHDNKNYFDSCKYYNKFYNMPLCKMYDRDDKFHIQILEFIKGNHLFDEVIDFNERINIGYNYFRNCKKHLVEIDDEEISFEKAVNNMIENLKTLTLPDNNSRLIKEFELKSNHFFKTYNNSYLIHGDLHHDNMLYCNGKIVAIDLSPRQASFAIEVAKFIENELFNQIEKTSQILDNILSLYKFHSIEEDELLEGLFIDSCYRTFDSFLEEREDANFEKGINMNEQILKYLERRCDDGL